jgi:exonuclease III
MNSESRFTIISYNVCGLINPVRIAELTMFLTTHKPSVLILQEPQINHLPYIKKGNKITPQTPKRLPSFTGYASLYFTHPSKPTGVAFYIHKSCTYKPLYHIPHCTPYRPESTNTIAGFVWVSSPLLPQPVVVGGVYLHSACKQRDVDALASNIARASQPLAGSPALSPPIPVYVLGDFNARHTSWDSTIHDAASKCMKGKWVHKKLLTQPTRSAHTEQIPLTLINNMFTTSRHVPTREESETVIDLALTSHPNTVEGMYVMSNSGVGSDHWPILITISNTYPNIQEPVHVSQVQDLDIESKYDESDLKQGIPPPRDTYEPLIVKLSNIPGAGYGLFANKTFKKGERIIIYTGEIIDESTKTQRYPDDDGEYVMYVMRDMYIDAVDPNNSSVARYINSSGGGYNNAKISPYHRNGEHYMSIVATRNITPGQEIFMPYGSSYRMTRAQPPHKTYAPTLPTPREPTLIHPNPHWEQHLTAPPQHHDDARVKWRINPNVDWKLFQQHIDTTPSTLDATT